jgi:hypothetical protein
MKQPPLIDTAGPARSHLTRKMTHSEVLQTFRACQSHGGSFMRALATAGLSADPENVGKILRTWPQIEQVYGPGSKFYKREKF